MKRNQSFLPVAELGYTIVEVMIVLAVTGLMAVATAVAINGRQNVTEFQTSVNNLKTQIQQVANEVANGTFPDHDGTYCQKSASGKPVLTTTPPADGSDGECMFVGKLLHFYSSGTATNTFSVTPLVGLNQDDYGSDPTNTYASAKLIADAGKTVTNTLGYGMVLQSLKLPMNEGSFAFVQSLNNSSYSTAGGYAQHINILGLGPSSGSSSTNQSQDELNAFNAALATGNTPAKPLNYYLNPTITMCFDSGSTNQHATFTIDANNSNLDVESSIDHGSCS